MLRDAGDEIERHRQYPEHIVEAMVERGIFKMLLPKSIGGAELDPLTYTAVLEDAGAGRRQLAPGALGQNSGCSMIAPYLAAEIAREVFGGPRGILAWGPELPGAGKCVAVEGGYRRHRAVGFCDRQPARDLARRALPGVRGRRQPAARAERPPDHPHDAVAEIARRRSSTTGRCSACAAPAATAIGSTTISCREAVTAVRDNVAERRETRPLYQFTSGMIYAMSFSHVSLGIARGAYDSFIEIARDKMPRGSKGTLRTNNVIQSQVSQCEAKLQIGARLPARRHRRDVGRGAATPAGSAPSTTRNCASPRPGRSIRRATWWRPSITRPAPRRSSRCNPLERRMRDIHAGTQQGQGRPIHFETVGQMLMGLPPEGRMFR